MKIIAKYVVLVFTLLAIILFAGCEEDPIVEQNGINWSEPLAYAYYEHRTQTNNFGGVTGHSTYMHYGIIKESGKVVDESFCTEHYAAPQISVGDENKIVHHYTETVYKSGRVWNHDSWSEIVLTEETLKSIGSSEK